MKSMHIYRDTPVTQGIALSRKDRCRLTAVAVPVVNRIIHHSHIFMLGGESYRLKSKLGH